MGTDEALVQRVRAETAGTPGLSEMKAFGGLSFLVYGNLACGVIGVELIVRVKPEETQQALFQPHTRVFDMTGRPMKGWIVVTPSGLGTQEELRRWVQHGVNYAASLPAKKP